MSDPHATLGLSGDETLEQIKDKWHLELKLLIDEAGSVAEAEKKPRFKELNAAYNALKKRPAAPERQAPEGSPRARPRANRPFFANGEEVPGGGWEYNYGTDAWQEEYDRFKQGQDEAVMERMRK